VFHWAGRLLGVEAREKMEKVLTVGGTYARRKHVVDPNFIFPARSK